MDKEETFRNLVHMCAVIFLVYYPMPDRVLPDPFYHFYKWHGVLVIMIITLIIEIIRLRKGRMVYGLRPNERHRITSLAWFTIAMGIALLVYDIRFVVPVVIGIAFIDPLNDRIKHKSRLLYPLVPTILYACIMLACLSWLTEMAILPLLLLTAVATASAMFSEWWGNKAIDDNFLMILLPLSLLTALDYLLSL